MSHEPKDGQSRARQPARPLIHLATRQKNSFFRFDLRNGGFPLGSAPRGTDGWRPSTKVTAVAFGCTRASPRAHIGTHRSVGRARDSLARLTLLANEEVGPLFSCESRIASPARFALRLVANNNIRGTTNESDRTERDTFDSWRHPKSSARLIDAADARQLEC